VTFAVVTIGNLCTHRKIHGASFQISFDAEQ
jgi:hypothetical protein